MRRAWFCDACGKEYTMEAWAKTCEGTHEPFIRADVVGPIEGEFVLFHPKHGDIVIELASLIKSIDTNEAGPCWIPRFHVDQAKAKAEKSE